MPTKPRAIKISQHTRELFEQREKAMDQDPDAPTLPLEMWANGTIGKYYRPIKKQVTTRIDLDVLEWLKSKGDGHLTRVNALLREAMEREAKTRKRASH